jgi:hypothetical protein
MFLVVEKRLHEAMSQEFKLVYHSVQVNAKLKDSAKFCSQ